MENMPITVRAFERFLSIMHALVDRERTRDGECLPTSWEVTQVWLCSYRH